MNPSTVATVITWVCLAGVIACNIGVIHYGRRTTAAARRAEAAAMNAHRMAEVAEAARDEANRYASSACVASLNATAAKVAASVTVANAGGLTPTELAATIREQRGSGHRG